MLTGSWGRVNTNLGLLLSFTGPKTNKKKILVHPICTNIIFCVLLRKELQIQISQRNRFTVLTNIGHGIGGDKNQSS
jgi:hypothetical protein